MPQVVETQITQARFLYRVLPSRIRQLIPNGLAAKGKAELRMLAAFPFQPVYRITI
jgi:hypothetical protein